VRHVELLGALRLEQQARADDDEDAERPDDPLGRPLVRPEDEPDPSPAGADRL
jgi:hypothetical protein